MALQTYERFRDGFRGRGDAPGGWRRGAADTARLRLYAVARPQGPQALARLGRWPISCVVDACAEISHDWLLLVTPAPEDDCSAGS